MDIKRYEINRIVIEGKQLTNMAMFHYHKEFSDMNNFTMGMNQINSILNKKNIKIHTIRIADNCAHLLYNKSNTYDRDGRYRYGYENGPIISGLKLVNVVYLYHEDDTIIGTIYLKEVNK